MADEQVRLSDAERDRALVQLREHAASGRLGLDELDDRSARILAARTRADLAAALGDLPDPGAFRARLARVSLGAHALAFVLVNAALLVVWEATREQHPDATDEGAGYWWPFWIIAVWAIALVAHAARRRRPRRRALPR